MSQIQNIIRYETGEMGEEEVVDFFQDMITDGTVWKLQGHYGRTAQQLIEAGLCFDPRSRDYE